MASPRSSARDEERRFNLQTLAIASAASATAAVVTSQLWIAGTWIAAALTPVLVTLISELLHRPTEKIAERMSADQRAPRPEHRDPDSAPVRIYRSTAPAPRRRKIAVGAVLGTAALALLIAVVVLTATELATGGAVGRSNARTTFLSPDREPATGEPDKREPTTDRTDQSTATIETTTETTAEETTTREQPTTTTPTPTTQAPTTTTPAPATGEQP